MDKILYDNFIKILESELIVAMGCTEPIAIAYAAAKAKEVLGCMPVRMVVRCSGNIVKNVKGVIVPNSGGQKGVAAAAIVGIVGGDSSLGLEVISRVTDEQIAKSKELVKTDMCTCELEPGEENLFIHVEVYAGEDSAVVEVKNKHDHISKIIKNNKVLLEQNDIVTAQSGDKSKLNLKDIIDFAKEVKIEDIEELIARQIKYNSAIAKEGLEYNWGSRVGKTLLESNTDDTRTLAKAMAAAGSDARMNGCALPVVINSGSGNQGITCTMPVLVYSQRFGSDKETLYRALVLTNLIALHQKRYIGNLSAYCGAVSAGTAAACGIAFLKGADYDIIGKTIINSLGNVGGIVCDGAKASCAAKITSAVEAGILGYDLAIRGQSYPFGEGLVDGDYEQTIRNIGFMGKEGMHITDETILNIMLGNIHT